MKKLRGALILKITKLFISENISKKSIKFNKKNIIFSSNNSVGKTSLIRMILYSAGYDVPSTKGFNFKKMNFQSEWIISGKVYNFFRNNDFFYVENISNDESFKFSVREDKFAIQSILYGNNNPQILRNIIGTHYFDQEKGWSKPNRGKVIGNIDFSIEDLIEGLSSDKLLDLNIKLKNLVKEKQLYLKIKPLLEISKENYKNQHYSNFNNDQLLDRMKSTEMKINMTKHKISNYKKILSDNNNLSNFIDNMKLRIKTKSNETQVIRKEDIIGFRQTQNMINAQITRYSRDLEELEKNRSYLRQRLDESMTLLDLESQLDKFKIAISDLNLSSLDLEKILDQYSGGIKNIKDTINESLYRMNITNIIFNRIKSYARILGVSDVVDNNPNFLFIKSLKQYSGAKLHLLVFAFRLALLKEIENKTHETIPLILDSPMSGELDEENVKRMFNLINKHFSDNQIIVATIANLYDIEHFDKLITIKDHLFEN